MANSWRANMNSNLLWEAKLWNHPWWQYLFTNQDFMWDEIGVPQLCGEWMVVALNLVISENPLKTRGDKKHIVYIFLFHIAIVGFPIKLFYLFFSDVTGVLNTVHLAKSVQNINTPIASEMILVILSHKVNWSQKQKSSFIDTRVAETTKLLQITLPSRNQSKVVTQSNLFFCIGNHQKVAFSNTCWSVIFCEWGIGVDCLQELVGKTSLGKTTWAMKKGSLAMKSVNRGWKTTQLYGDYFINHEDEIRIPINQPGFNGK